MSRVLYCLHDDCHEEYLSEAGKRPGLCPACNRVARWTTLRPTGQKSDKVRLPPGLHARVAAEGPTAEDRRFLRSMRIAWEVTS